MVADKGFLPFINLAEQVWKSSPECEGFTVDTHPSKYIGAVMSEARGFGGQ